MKAFFRRNLTEIAVIIGAMALIMTVGCLTAKAADTYTPDLRIVQMPTGSNDTQWGVKANAAFAMLEQAIAGGSIISVTASDVTLTTANNSTDQARNAVIAFTGTPGVTRNVTMPNVSKLTWVLNSSNANIIFTAGAGVNSTVIPGAVALLYTDGLTNTNTVTEISTFAAGVLLQPDAGTTRTALGLGSIATHPTTDFMAAGSGLLASNNLSELTASAATARTNIGLGTVATFGVASGAVAGTNAIPAMSGTLVSGNLPQLSGTAGLMVDSGFAASGFLTKAGNFAGLASPTAARVSLGAGGGVNVPVVTVSTSAPSGSGTNVGDLWIRVQ